MQKLESEIPNVSPELVTKFSGAGPRYTSYPTAVEFHSDFHEVAWRQALSDDLQQPDRHVRSQARPSSALSLYFHLPFCQTLCYFCACNKIIPKDRDGVSPYLDALLRELRMYRELVGPGQKLEQIHWGGGTPNYLTPAEMERLHRATLEHFPQLVPDADVSIEIDPRTVTRDHLRCLRSLGFNRVSLGVQDFSSAVQETINRVQPYEMTREVIEWAREEGFSGINVDLIYGLPNQTYTGFQKTLNQVLTLRPDRVALYGYAHVTWIKKVQKALERAHLPSASERIELLQMAIREFSLGGYRYIGLDHFALPHDSLSLALEDGTLNRNFMGYTNHSGARILACGVSAISSLPLAFGQNTKDLLKYQEAIAHGRFPIERGCARSRDDCIRGDVIEALLCSGRLDLERFEAFWGVAFEEYFSKEFPLLNVFVSDGLLTVSSATIALTDVGRLFARNVAMLFDSYLEKHRQQEKPVFSQAV